MKISLPFISGLVLIAFLFFSSCTKKKDPEPTKAQLLTHAKGWKLTAFTGTSSTGVVTNLFSSFDTCESDNIITFQSSGAYNEDEGSTKCNASDPQTVETGTWTLSSNDTILTIIPVGQDSQLATVTITAATLSITLVDTSGSSPYTFVETFNAQ
jgi:Lipocalin-like domain